MWRATLGTASAGAEGAPFFIKPAEDAKAFNGEEATREELAALRARFPASFPVLCTEKVDIVCEYRVYVASGRVLAACHCPHPGCERAPLDMAVVEGAVATLEESGEALRGYAIDFCIMKKDSALITSLLEVNDGAMTGFYEGVSDTDFAAMVEARWAELLRGGVAQAGGRELKVHFVLGPPGVGKGTVCARLVAAFGPRVVHVSTGDLIRAEISAGTEMGSQLKAILDAGRGVTTSQLLELVGNAFRGSSAEMILLDGFPRTLEQSVEFERRFGPPAGVLALGANEAALLERLDARGRADDTATFIQTRLRFYREQSTPVTNKYRGVARSVDCERSADDVFADVAKALKL
jgi:adenylate kinase family enzyme